MVGHTGDCFAKVKTETSAEGSMHSDHRGDENNSNKSGGDALESANSRNVGGVCSTDGRIWPSKPDPRNLGIGHNRIWAKADKVDSKLSMIKDHVTLRLTSGKSWIVIPTRKEWGKNWPHELRKGHIWFTDGVCNQWGTGAGICIYQSKIRWHISLGQDATAFQAGAAAILDCAISCLGKRLVKEQTTICFDSQVGQLQL